MKKAHQDRAVWIVGLIGAAAALAGGIAYFAKPTTAAAATGATGTAPSTAQIPITLLEDVGFNPANAQKIVLAPGQQVALSPPVGAVWNANNSGTVATGFGEAGLPLPTTGNSPLILTYMGPAASSQQISWSDSSGIMHDSLVTVATS